jgi:hypothetical protein
MKIELDEDTMDAIVVEKLKEYKVFFEKWDGYGLPHVDFDKKIENKYRKKMRKSIDRVLEFCGTNCNEF